jgi:3-phenylpropionate/trans-cinnamate dioxygenase ferredoxin component
MPEFYDALPTDWLAEGDSETVEVDGFPVAVANVGGEHFAYQHICPHEGTAFGKRKVEEGCIITCPLHGSRYDVRSGECVTPAPDGFSQALRTYQVRVVGDVVQIRV